MANSGRPVIGITLDIEGEYLKLKHHYSSAIIKAGGMPVMIPLGSDANSAASLVDGLLIPGGDDIDPSYLHEEPHPSVKPVSRERTDMEIRLIEAVTNQRKPLFGICYGMQLMSIVFGGALYQDIESQAHWAKDHRAGGHGVRLSDDFCDAMGIDKKEYTVNSTHHQAVRDAGGRLDVFAMSDDGIIEGFYMKDYPFLIGVQWHPERSGDELSAGLFRGFVESAHGDR